MKIPVAITWYPERQHTAITVKLCLGRNSLHLFPDVEFFRRYSRLPRLSYTPIKSPTDLESHFLAPNIGILIRKVVPLSTP